ncbi:CRP-like cAMP-activated global transcriptional regulator [anaerobic digester metagenome]
MNIGNTNCNYCAFRNQVCQTMSEEEFSQLNDNTSVINFEKGEPIIVQGNELKYLVYISSGLVKLEHIQENKEIHIPAIIKASALLSGSFQFSSPVNLYSVIAVEDTTACLIDMNTVRYRMKVNSHFSVQIFEMLSEFYQRVLDKQLTLACKRVPGRVAAALLMFSEKFYQSDKFIFPLTRREISHLTSCSEENVIRTLSSFEQDGIITVSGKSVQILHPEKLKRIYNIG